MGATTILKPKRAESSATCGDLQQILEQRLPVLVYSHPEVDRIWGPKGIYYGSFKGHILSGPGWLYAHPGA